MNLFVTRLAGLRRRGAAVGALVILLLILTGAARAQAPCVAIAGADRDICSGQTTALGVGPVAGYTYRWSPSTGLSNPNIANPTVRLFNRALPSVVRSYTLTVTGTASGCTATSTVNITVKPGPVADPGPNRTVCSGQVFMVGTPALPGYTYQWPVGNAQAGLSIDNPNLAQPTYTATNPNQASFFRNVLLRVTAPNGCDTLVTLVVTVLPAITAQAGPDVSLCAGTPTTIGTPAQPGFTYSWSPATGLSSATVANPTVTQANPGSAPLATTYTLTVTNAAGCTATDQTVATVYPPAVAPAAPAVAVCAGQAATLALGAVPVPGTTYSWSPATGLSNPNVLSPTLTLTTPGSYTYTLTASVAPVGATACTATTTVPVTVAPLPVAQAAPNGPITFCANDTRPLGGAAAVPGISYRWRPATGVADPTAPATTITLPNATAAPLTTTYTLVATSAAGCADSSQVGVTVNPAAVADAGPAATLCPGLATTLGTPALPGYTYSWSPATGLDDAAAARPRLTVANPTAAPLVLKYYLTATPAGSGAACPGRDSVLVTVNPALAAVISGPAVLCDLSQLQAYEVTAAPAGSAYQWSATGGSITSGQGTARVTVQFAPGASYGLSATATSDQGCASPPGALAIRYDQARVELAVASVDAASNNSLTIGFAAVGSNPVQVLRRVAGQGSFAAVGTAPANATSFTDTGVDAAANSYEYRLDLADACGTAFSSALAQTIRLQATATAGAGGRDQGATALSWNAYVGFPVQEYRLYRSLDGAAPELLRTVPGGTLQASIPAGAGFSQQFRVVAVSAAPALQAGSNTASVTFANAVHTYNVITPNGDRLNDVLVVDNIGLYPGNTLRIFNRWGREVYNATNYQNDWGREPGLAPGVYYYLLTLPGPGTTMKGWVEVMK